MIRSFRFVSIGLLTLVAVCAGCGAAPLSPTEVRTLSNAERLWAARSFQDYVFELRRSCFCPVEFFQWSRIEVVGGRVTRVTVIETGADLPPAFWSGFPTVEQIFERIRSSAADDYVKDVVAEFDEALGFPSLVSVTAKANVADGDFAYYLRNARPLQ